MSPQTFQWQTLHKDDAEIVRRARLPHGWLVSHVLRVDPPVAPALVFVPDDGHRWALEEEGEEGHDGAASPSLQEAAVRVVATSGHGVVTTQAELDCFEVVRDVLHAHDPSLKVGFLDTPTYFGIHLGGPSQWVARICVTPRASWIGLNVPEEQAAGEFGLERLDANWASTVRFELRTAEDLKKLKPLFIAAAEALQAS